MKAFIATVSTLILILTMTACTAREGQDGASSVAPNPPSAAAPPAASEPAIASDIESGVEDAVSAVESAVTPAMSTDFNKIGALGSDQIKWGPGVQVDADNRTVASDGLQQQYEKYSAYFIAPNGTGKFYLTFDEGYENGYTPAILDILKEKDVSAVFFVTLPFAKSQPELIRRMIDEGHIIGNHTNRHWNPTKKTIEEAYQDIADLHEYMIDNYGYEMYLYRPPEGAFSEKTLAMAQSLGYTTVLWSFAYADWDPNKQPSYDDALAKTTKYIHDGAIYLLHAVSKTNADILGALIDEVRARGLTPARWDLPYIPAE